MPDGAASRGVLPPDATQALAEALRDGAARASELAAGAHALIFARAPGGAPRLRAAAGFATPEEARERASALAGTVAAALDGGAPATAGLCARLALGDRVHGVLLLDTRAPLADAAARELRVLAGALALRLDHAALAEELAAARSARPEPTDPDKLLELSEQLFAQDIELIRKEERLGKIERLKNDFIEKMSRELRTPLNSIIESIIAVLAGENENLSESGRQALRRALDEGSSFLRTLQNILDLWRIKQGELPVEIQEVNFREVVDEAIFSVQDALGDKPIQIEKHVVEPLPKIRTDLTKVNQLLFQLLENAVKFTREGTIRIHAEVDDEQLVCRVEDTGIGICPDDRQFLFDEFFQVDDAADTHYRGSGLGLALVRDLVKLLDGELEIESEVGQGSTFAFRVPVERL